MLHIVCASMLLIYSGRDKFLDTLAQRCYTPFLSGLSTTCGVKLIREAQYVDYVVFNNSMKGGEKDGRK